LKLKTRVLLSLFLAALAAGHAQSASAQAGGWSRYTYPGEEFSVELPGMPTLSNASRGVNNDWRKEEKVRVFSHYSGGVVFFVVAYDNSHGSESPDFFATYLRGAWGLEPKGALTLAGFEGRSYAVVGAQRGRLSYNLRGEGRVFRTRRHAYLALAVSQEEERPEVGRFLDSFTLGASPAGERIAEEESVPRFVPPKTEPVPPAGAVWGPGRGGAGEPLAAGDRKAQIIYKPEPGYTEEARQKGVSGRIILRAALTPDGTVTDIEPVKWLPNGLTERAIRSARQMRFFPAVKGGQPVSQYVTLEYNFNVY